MLHPNAITLAVILFFAEHVRLDVEIYEEGEDYGDVREPHVGECWRDLASVVVQQEYVEQDYCELALKQM